MKKIIKSICFSVLAFLLAIGSFFVPLTPRNTNSAQADVSSFPYSAFTSSNIIFSEISGYYSTDFIPNDSGFNNLHYLSDNQYAFYNFSFRLLYDSSGTSLSFQSLVFLDKYSFISNIGSFDSWSTLGSINNFNMSQPILSEPLTIYRYNNGDPLGFALTKFAFICHPLDTSIPSFDGLPSMEMMSVEIGSSSDFNSLAGTDYDFEIYNDCTVVSYVNTNGYRFTFFVPNWNSDSSSSNYLTYRKYYFIRNATNNEYYQQGLAEGSSIGYDKGYTDGYSIGSESGYQDGLEEGKIIGAVEANDYSFFGLISAVIDTPIQLFKSLFNFNFLGVNLFAFFTSILTIGLIVFVTKLFLRR